MSGLGILGNATSLYANNRIAQNNRTMNQSMQRLSSGMRINSAADDAAGVAQATSLEASARSLKQAQRNANDGAAMLQVADGAAGSVSDILVRMRELAVQAGNGTLEDADREALNVEFAALIEEVDRIADGTTFNGKQLTDGSVATVTFQVGANGGDEFEVDLIDITSNTLGVNGLSIDTQGDASSALADIDGALETLNEGRAAVGSGINRLNWAADSLGVSHANISQALSQVRDVDIAQESSRLSKSQVLINAGVSMLAQSNAMPNLALRLIG